MGIVDGGYSLAKLGRGAVRAVIALDPVATAIPANIADVIAMNNSSGAYALAAGWTDLGATTEGASYSRGMEEAELEIEQAAGAIDAEITEVPRSVTLPMAHIADDAMKIIENSTTVASIAAVSNKSAQQRNKFGLFSDLPVYRICLIGIRSQKAGIVTENAGGAALKRGRMVMLSLYRVQLEADASEFEFSKGSLWSGDVGFRAFPEPGQASGEEHGSWFFENAGTIT